MSRFAVIGNPVAHSKSPLIHRLFAAQCGLTIEYEAIQVETEDLSEFLDEFFRGGGKGLNVTLPLKEAAYKLCQRTSSRAALAAATNTLFLDADGSLSGDNTDGAGLVTDIEVNHGFSIVGKSVLLLGAGGAVRGVLGPMIEKKPAAITVLNRTLARAEQLSAEFAELMPLRAMDYDSFQAQRFDLIVNGTSMSLSGEVPALGSEVLADGGCCYDMMYSSSDTAFVAWAKENGAGMALDGLGMLVEQAAESFRIWHGKCPDTAPVLARLRG